MSLLRISLFGSLRVARDGQPYEPRLTPISQGLLAYLLLQRHRSHPREVLASLFWGDRSEERARSCLSTALWRLRRHLEPDDVPRETYLTASPSGEVGFNRDSDYWLDVAVFEEHVSQVLSEPIHAIEAADAQRLQSALELYVGELLEGFYDDWALQERERLRLMYLNGLAHLMRYHRYHCAYEESLSCGQRILVLDPLREEIHREMMRLYLESGQRALAVRQYGLCREILAAELNIPPMEETQALFLQIVPEAGYGSIGPTAASEPVSLQQALQQFRRAMQSFDEARERLQRAIQLVERFAERRD